MIGYNIHGGHFVFFLPFHSTILEPDFYLSFGEAECVRNFDASSAGQVTIEMEFFFEFQRLIAGV